MIEIRKFLDHEGLMAQYKSKTMFFSDAAPIFFLFYSELQRYRSIFFFLGSDHFNKSIPKSRVPRAPALVSTPKFKSWDQEVIAMLLFREMLKTIWIASGLTLRQVYTQLT